MWTPSLLSFEWRYSKFKMRQWINVCYGCVIALPWRQTASDAGWSIVRRDPRGLPVQRTDDAGWPIACRGAVPRLNGNSNSSNSSIVRRGAEGLAHGNPKTAGSGTECLPTPAGSTGSGFKMRFSERAFTKFFGVLKGS